MAMVSVVNWQPTSRLTAQVKWLGPKVGSHLPLCWIHCMNRVNSLKIIPVQLYYY